MFSKEITQPSGLNVYSQIYKLKLKDMTNMKFAMFMYTRVFKVNYFKLRSVKLQSCEPDL